MGLAAEVAVPTVKCPVTNAPKQQQIPTE